MNKNQEYILRKALEQMQIVRHMLDDIMYRTDPLSPEEFKKIRECYDLFNLFVLVVVTVIIMEETIKRT